MYYQYVSMLCCRAKYYVAFTLGKRVYYYVPRQRGGGHIVFGVDPVGVSVSVTLSCLHDIS